MQPHNGRRRALVLVIYGVAAWLATVTALQAQTGSAQAAKDLASLMSERQLDAFAAQDPESPSRFLATLLIPNVQMLVVSAEYPVPAELQSQLALKNYRDVYAALHQPASSQSRFFLIDLACDGLRGDDESVDVLYERGTTQTLFNGDWTKQGLSEQAYKQRLKDTELRYARILTQLKDGLKAPAAGTTVQK